MTESEWYLKEHIGECYDEDGEFDWEEYQRLCDEVDYWEME